MTGLPAVPRQTSWRTAMVIGMCVGLMALPARPQAPATPDEIPLPEPKLEALEPGVRERLETAWEALLGALENSPENPVRRGRLYGHTGEIFHAHHLFAVAEACYQNAILLLPDEVQWPYLVGFLYQDTGRLALARDQYRRVLELDADHPLAALRLGQVLLEMEEIDEAEPLLLRVVDEPGLGAAAHAGLGKVALVHKEYDLAAEHYEAALALQPGAGRLHFPLSQIYRQLGDMEAAREHAGQGAPTKVQVQDSILSEVGSLTVSSEMFLTTGAQALKAKRFDLAERAFRAAIEANPENQRAHLNLAVVLAKDGRLDAAEESAREALRIDPDYVYAYFNLGTIYEARGQQAEAVTFYLKALAGDPQNLKANFQLANLLMQAGDFDGAARHYRATIEVAPSFVQARYLEALALIAQGRTALACQRLEEALEIQPGQPQLMDTLARLLATSLPIDPEAAARALDLARELSRQPELGDQREAMAMALAAGGSFEEAGSLQESLIAAARERGDTGAIRHLEHNLARYRSQLPSDQPWSVDEP